MRQAIVIVLLVTIACHGANEGSPEAQTEATRPVVASNGDLTNLDFDSLIAEGRELWETRKPQAMRQSLKLFQRATEINPDSAEGWAGVADASALIGLYALDSPAQTMPRALEAAKRALELEPRSSTHASLGLAQYLYSWDFVAAEASFRKAIELDPDNGSAHHWFAMMLSALQRHDEAIDQISAALAADPDSPLLNSKQVTILTAADRSEEAEARLGEVKERFPTYSLVHREEGLLRLQQGRLEEATRSLQRALGIDENVAPNDLPRGPLYDGSAKTLGALGHVFARRNLPAPAERLLQILRERSHGQPIFTMEIAHILAGLDRQKEALSSLNEAMRERDPGLVYLFIKPGYDRLDQKKMSELAAQIGIPNTVNS